MRDSNDDVLYVILMAIVIILGCAGGVYTKTWRYEECLNVGHTETYCQAEALGCFGSK
jgi:ABC-type molybdate transport system substrate-binding protein